MVSDSAMILLIVTVTPKQEVSPLHLRYMFSVTRDFPMVSKSLYLYFFFL